MSRISRAHQPYLGDDAPEIEVSTDPNDSQTIDMRAFVMLRYKVVFGDIASIVWYESDSPDGPWSPCHVGAVPVQTTAGNYWTNLPLDAAGAHYLRGASVGDDGTIKIVLKG
jgi:hypothetical protein